MAGRSGPKTARLVGLTVLGVIAIALTIFLVIGWLEGDPTNDLEQRQPEPASSSPDS